MDPNEWWLALLALRAPRPRRAAIRREVAAAGSAEAYLTREREGMRPARLVNWGRVERMRERLTACQAELVTFLDRDHPDSFHRVPRPPLLLFCRGRRELLAGRAVAIVGRRRATAAGAELAHGLAFELARRGLVVVSGLAEGIDTAAHRGALEAGGETVAFLGCGVDVVYPHENGALQEEIAARGLLVSEYPPGTGPRAAHFPQRNRLVSARAEAVIVVEAGRRSGALLTAECARGEGKRVMAVPGSPGSPESAGANWLIKARGAVLVEDAEDVARCLRLPLGGAAHADPARGEAAAAPPAPGSPVLGLLGRAAVPADAIARALRRPISEVLADLLELELLGLVESEGGGAAWRRTGGGGAIRE